MDRTERFYRIDQLLHERRAVPLADLIDELGVSRATIKRDIEYLRDRLSAPIVWDRDLRGYRYDSATGEPAARYALPGLWFNATEVHALLTMEHLLANLQPGLLGPHIEPLRARIRMLLDSGDHAVAEVERRIRILLSAARPVEQKIFQAITSALLRRRRLRIAHYNRRTDAITEREISPQRLVYYRDNWYLDAWCHLRRDLRSFGVDVIRRVQPVERPAREVGERTLKAFFESGYGIFAGHPTGTAVLRFSPERARWVGREIWHPDQQGQYDEAGRYVLSVPYSDDTELLLDVARYGPDVEVLAPASLREKVSARLRAALAVYEP